MEHFTSTPQSFSSPLEELRFLKEEVERREQALSHESTSEVREDIMRQVTSIVETIPSESLHPVTQAEQEAMTLRLAPEEHDSAIEELYGMLLEQGLKKTLSYIRGLSLPYLEDDFHRFLVQLLFETHTIAGLKETDPEYKGLSLVLFEVTFPASKDEKTFREFLGAMEQFFVGMQGVATNSANEEHAYYTIEIAQASGSNDVVVYVGIPRSKALLFEKQIVALYSTVKIQEATNDYNVFDSATAYTASYATLDKDPIYPLRTFGDGTEQDPMSSIISTFSKLRTEDGASIQYVITPVGNASLRRMTKILELLEEGKKAREAIKYDSSWQRELTTLAKGFIVPPKDSHDKDEHAPPDTRTIELVKEKMQKTLMAVSLRVVTSGDSIAQARDTMHEMQSSFRQFARPTSNEIIFKDVEARALDAFVHAFAYRLCDSETDMIVNVGELASLFHFPVVSVASPDLKEAKAGQGPAPRTSGDGIFVGRNTYRGESTDVTFATSDRVRHMYVIGQTGTGKTGALLTMIAQDIARGDGVCYIDPHGTDIQTILSMIPKHRIDDVIYFDPAYTPRPMGLNMLEYDRRYPEQKTFVINELMGIFNQLFDMKTSGGPMFEQYFKNSAALVMDHPESGATLLEIGRVLSDKAFRDMKLSHCTNPIIKQFWANAEKTTGEQGLENFVPYITSKFDNFISNEIMRPVVAQERSSFNFRDIMDNRKILLVNLSKGRLGEINANLIGLLLVGKIQMAALSRVDMFGKDFPPFYLYIDEFQNVTTPSIASILSEARKYKLSLTVAHQYLNQLSEDIKSAILGNVGSMAVFRISPEDASLLESRFVPTFTKEDIIKLENRNAYVSLLIGGQPSKPFNMKTLDITEGDTSMIDKIKELSYLTYGRDRQEVEEEIFAKYTRLSQ